MAREMVATGDWITPRLNAIKYFEKPPLQIWMTALAFNAFGLGEWQARLWTGLCGFFGIVMTAYAGRKVFGARTGFAAGLVLASSLFWSALGHINTLDMGLSGMMTLALTSLLIAQRRDANASEQRNWMLMCWAGMALSVMSKGLIGLVLPGAVLVIYSLLSRDWMIWKRLHLGLGLLVFFGITTPWFVLVSLKNPEFPHFFFIHEHFQRFSSKIHHREGPWYYFIPLLILGILPWLGVLFQSIWASLRDNATGFQPKKLLIVWAGFIFIFFSISGSKLPSYILPIFPALALLIALHADAITNKTWNFVAGLVASIGVAGVIIAGKIPQLATETNEIAHYQSSLPWVNAASIVLLTGGLLVLWWSKKDRDDMGQRAVITLAISGFLSVQLLMLGTEPYGRYRSGFPLVPAITAELQADTKLYAVGLYDQTLPFYLRRTMTLVQHPDELEFGLKQEPSLWIPTRDAFIAEWRNGKKAVAITRPEIFADFEKRGVPMRLITRDARRVVIANDVAPNKIN